MKRTIKLLLIIFAFSCMVICFTSFAFASVEVEDITFDHSIVNQLDEVTVTVKTTQPAANLKLYLEGQYGTASNYTQLVAQLYQKIDDYTWQGVVMPGYVSGYTFYPSWLEFTDLSTGSNSTRYFSRDTFPNAKFKVYKNWENEFAELENSYAQVVSERDAALAAKSEAEASLAVAQQNLQNAQNTINQLNNTVTSQNYTISEKQAALERVQNDLNNANANLQKAQEDLALANIQLTEANNNITELQGRLAGKEDELAQTITDLQATQAQLSDIQLELETTTANYNSTKTALDTANETIESLRAEIQALQEAKDKADAELAAMTEELAAAKADAQAANQTVEQLTQEKAALEQQLEEAQGNTEELQTELDKVNAELTKAENDLKDAQATVKEAEAEIERLKNLIEVTSMKNAEITALPDMIYTGQALTPSFQVTLNGSLLEQDTDYMVYYVNNVNVGTATVIITGEGKFRDVYKTSFQIKKAPNPMVAKGKTVELKYTTLKKQSLTVLAKNAFSVTKAKGKVTYKKTNGNPKITVSSAGKITVKKGIKKGTYNVKVLVKAAGNSNYKVKTKTVTVTIKVK